MPKINQEEYEILKGLDDKWKWIVRNDQWQLEVRKDKPFKKGHVWSEEVTNHSFSNDIDLGSFHFIQWNDINGHEEPYNIAELIREYEIKELRIAPSGTVIVDSFDESEGTEVLSQEWIDEHKVARISNLRKMTMSDVVPVGDLQNLLVPKQEITKVPQEWFDVIKRNKDMTLETILRIANPKREEEERFVKAWLAYQDIEVEEKQKYHVADGNDTLLCKSNGVVMTVGKLWAIGNEREAEYDLTEQEIKDYDERYWPFRKPVEELEE